MPPAFPLYAAMLLLLACAPAAAQEPVYDGPPPPQLPATLARDDAGRTTVRAVRLSAPLRVDGSLDEEVYRTVEPISGASFTSPFGAISGINWPPCVLIFVSDDGKEYREAGELISLSAKIWSAVGQFSPFCDG